ncbi:MAG: sulfotransferase family 2 domain-containing protein [Kiritimatiellia bacterium]|jgi:hypothetical protein|nr:sulfotransferase family 2 domain-containing protein [Kiritimatiellia bacterium]MDP6848550.1 sulfotransferase family 2 domain-containing protein [Kiritimatiellia bacterium]
MLISHRKRFIFTKTDKTAGTSVESYFEKYCMPEGTWEFSHSRDEYVSETGIVGYRGPQAARRTWHNHMSAAAIKQNIGDEVWNSYFKFTIIRNPFSKLVSAFSYIDKREKNRPLKERLRKLVRNIRGKGNALSLISGNNPVDRFRSWIHNGGAIVDRDRYFIDGDICVDYFIRFEDLADGVKHVCDVLDVPFEPGNMPKLKSGSRNKQLPLKDFYDKETTELVEDLYAFELKHFDYQMPS